MATTKDHLAHSRRKVLGTRKNKQHKDWFNAIDEQMKHLLEQKQQAFKLMLQCKSTDAKKKYQIIWNKVQGDLRKMKNDWFLRKACHTFRSMLIHTMLSYYMRVLVNCTVLLFANQTVYFLETAECLSESSMVLIEKHKAAKHWSEHFLDLLHNSEEIECDNLTCPCH